jgi:hypothetical protein
MGYAEELAAFFKIDEEKARTRLNLGFGYLHTCVAQDWRESNPQTDAEILEWYRKTPAYCWELSAYHADAGFNYTGMCRGIAEHLKGAGKRTPLCIGDGIGDMTIELIGHGLDAAYHDLAGSVTAHFAMYRFEQRNLRPWLVLSSEWQPPRLHPDSVRPDAVIAHDFFEHVVNVDEWVQGVYDMLPPGGLFLAQNAFAIGDPDHGGSIPMHLARNNYYADGDPLHGGKAGWDVVCERIGFVATGQGNWRVKP